MHFERIHIKAAGNRYCALVASPAAPIVLGRARLDELRTTGRSGDIDRAVIKELSASPNPCEVVILRGSNLARQSLWQFDTALSQEQRTQLALLLVRSQLETYISFAAIGVIGHFILGLGRRETLAMHKATATILSELEQHLEILPPEEAMRHHLLLHRHLLCHFSYFLFTDYEAALRDFVPRALPLLERDKDLLGKLLEAT